MSKSTKIAPTTTRSFLFYNHSSRKSESEKSQVSRIFKTGVTPMSIRKQPWLTDETLQVLEDKATARKRHDTTERRRLQGVFRAKAKEDRERYYNNLADEVEEGLLCNDLRPTYTAVRRMMGSSTVHITPVRKRMDVPATPMKSCYLGGQSTTPKP